VLRNIVLLIALGAVSNITVAAEFALHFWYSAFQQSAHQPLLAYIVMQLLDNLCDDNTFSLELGEQTLLTGTISAKTKALLFALIQSNLQPNEANNEINRVQYVV
jgi:hypothetical protein